jgi:hypothetical protein
MPFNRGDEVEVVATSDDLRMVGLNFYNINSFPNFSSIEGTVTFHAVATGEPRPNWFVKGRPITLVQIRNPDHIHWVPTRGSGVWWFPEYCVVPRVNTPQRRALCMFKEKYHALQSR